jgi:GNAT superfamily N-acetyltransferase
LSEFYRARRGNITDLTGLIFFVIGWMGSAPFAWRYIRAGLDTGDATSGIIRFAGVVFGAGISLGLVGLALGFVGGRIWESWHRLRRSHVAGTQDAPSPAPPRARASTEPRLPLPPLRFETGTIDIAPYTALAERAGTNDFDPGRAASALARSTNISAWEGERLVGIARLVTDGYFFAALAEITVDPSLQRRGLGRELLSRAYERTPRGVLYIGAPFGNSAFFDHIGCERGLTGFTMNRAPRTATQPPS